MDNHRHATNAAAKITETGKNLILLFKLLKIALYSSLWTYCTVICCSATSLLFDILQLPAQTIMTWYDFMVTLDQNNKWLQPDKSKLTPCAGRFAKCEQKNAMLDKLTSRDRFFKVIQGTEKQEKKQTFPYTMTYRRDGHTSFDLHSAAVEDI